MDREKTAEAKRRLALVILGAGGFGSWPIVSTPGLPQDRVKTLREAYARTLKDPAFLDEAKKKGWEIKPISGEDMDGLAREGMAQPPDVIERMKQILAQ